MKNTLVSDNIRREIIRDFVKFLKKKNAFVSYRVNTAKFLLWCEKKYMSGDEIHKFICEVFTYGIFAILQHRHKEYLDYNHAANLINYAFSWSTTKEGGIFWRKLDVEWKILVKNKYHIYHDILNEK